MDVRTQEYEILKKKSFILKTTYVLTVDKEVRTMAKGKGYLSKKPSYKRVTRTQNINITKNVDSSLRHSSIYSEYHPGFCFSSSNLGTLSGDVHEPRQAHHFWPIFRKQNPNPIVRCQRTPWSSIGNIGVE